MFLYARRVVQTQIDELAAIMGSAELEEVVAKLNRANTQRLGAFWEVATLHCLNKVGHVDYEKPLSNGRKPDIHFFYPEDQRVGFIADVTTVSDQGLEQNNPTRRFTEEMVRLAKLAGIDPGHLAFRIEAERDGRPGDEVTTLLLPSSGNMTAVLKEHLLPFFRRIKAERKDTDQIVVAHEDYLFAIDINTKRQGLTGSYPAYTATGSKENNPVWNALCAKVKQLKAGVAVAPCGIIICDGGCQLLEKISKGPFDYRIDDVVRDFLRRNRAISFVVTVAVITRVRVFGKYDRLLSVSVFVQDDFAEAQRLSSLIKSAFSHLPQVTCSPIVAAEQCRRQDVSNSYIGMREWSANMESLSSRAVLELLAGKINIDQFNEAHGWTDNPPTVRQQNPFRRALQNGDLFASVELRRQPTEDDDYISFSWAIRDPSISPFKVRQSGRLDRQMAWFSRVLAALLRPFR